MSGSSGGGASGSVDFPQYMKDWHEEALAGVASVDTMSNSVTDAINSAYGNSPFSGEAAYDPDTDITAMETAISTFVTILAGITDVTNWAAFYTQAEASIDDPTAVAGITEAVIVADVDAFADQLDDEITTKVLPRFQAGMRNINAVVSSSFTLGEAIIEGMRDRDVAKHTSAIRLRAAEVNAQIDLAEEKLKNEVKGLRVSASQQMLSLMLQRIAWRESVMKTTIEEKRIKIVAKKEQNDADLKIDESDALWDLSLFKYGGNVLASISGSAVSEKVEHNTTASKIGGGLSMIASGAMIGGEMGGGTGAVYGGLFGLGYMLGDLAFN